MMHLRVATTEVLNYWTISGKWLKVWESMISDSEKKMQIFLLSNDTANEIFTTVRQNKVASI